VKSVPKVSVVTVCYNQEQYIEEALRGFINQKTDFPFEVIVSDDKSTDKTPEIIARYAKEYPDIIKPILRKQNLGVVKNNIETLKATTGKYVALCEGDDYWTDPTKLQRQVDFLDKHPDYAVVFHPVRVFFEGDVQPEAIYPTGDDRPKSFTVKNLLKRNFIQTNSVMYRRPKSYDDMPDNILPLDWYFHLYHAQFGKIGFIDRVMGAYRRHPGGLWWDSYAGIHKIWKKYGSAHLALYEAILKLCGDNEQYREIVQGHITNLFINLAVVDKKYREQLVPMAVEQFPEGAAGSIYGLLTKIDELHKHSDEQGKIIDHLAPHSKALEGEIELRDARIAELTAQIEHLQSKLLIRLEGAVKRRIKHVPRDHT